jgi:hypothetical protein
MRDFICSTLNSHTLLQNTFIVSAGKVSFISARQADTIYMIWKGGRFSIGCFQPIPKIIIGIDCLKTADTNKCPVWLISKALLVSASLGRPTPLSYVQIENNIWIRYETCIFFKFRIHSNIYIRHSQEYSLHITVIHSSHSQHWEIQ